MTLRVGDVVHLRLAVRDVSRAAAFYSELFGWEVITEAGGERQFRTPGGLGGAFWPSGEPSTAGPEFYVRVVSVAATVRRAIELGGARLVRPGPVQGGRRVAQIVDPEGNRVGLWEDAISRED